MTFSSSMGLRSSATRSCATRLVAKASGAADALPLDVSLRTIRAPSYDHSTTGRALSLPPRPAQHVPVLRHMDEQIGHRRLHTRDMALASDVFEKDEIALADRVA